MQTKRFWALMVVIAVLSALVLSACAAPAAAPAAPADSEEAAPAEEARRSNDDVLTLSVAAQSAMAEPAFDRAKVDAIKDAIRDGNYPLDAKRIAENFVAIEQMIRE